METTRQYRATQCPSQDVLLAYCSGKLPEINLETIDSHLATCEVCLAFLDSQHQGGEKPSVLAKPPVLFSDEESAKSSLLDDTAVQRIQRDPLFKRMMAQIKLIELSVGGDTKPWFPEQRPAKRRSDKKLPENIGPYFVIDELGSGGFANVYLASDREGRQPVAIKVPRPDKLETPEQIDAYVEEARKSARLKHAHIVPAYFFERTPDGCYVVMKYIEGRSLEKAMKPGNLSYERIAEICIEVAGALDYAHKEGLIHRDIKPANILLDKQGLAYVADFGLAIHQDVQHDHKDEFAGTCAYMSPEQVSPGPHYFDHRTDIWSLGVVLYELLTQEKPFAGTSDAIRIDKILNHPVKPPRSINSNVPKELERICLKCLEKDISKRIPSGAELEAELRQWLKRVRYKPWVPPTFAWAGAVVLAASVVLAVTLAVMGYFNGGGDGRLGDTPGTGDPGKPTSTVEQSDALVKGPAEGPRQFPVGAVVAKEWESLFDVEPELFFGHPGPEMKPQFDVLTKSYLVKNKGGRWIATVRQVKSQHIHLRTKLSLHNWMGQGGFVWGFLEKDQSPSGQLRWRSVEFCRFGPNREALLVVRDLTLAGTSIVLENRGITDIPVNVPDNSEAILDIEIEPKLLTIRLENNPVWKLTAPHKDISTWLPETPITLGISGDSSHTVFRDPSVRFSKKEE